MTSIASRQTRATDALRTVRITRSFTMHAEGSVLIAFGNTQVLCTASVEEKVPPHKRGSGEGWLADGDTVTLGKHTLSVRHCPGHTPGHVVFYSPEIQRAFVGDVLFAGSIGRTDFPQGDHDTLIASITQRLWPMGNDTVFIPGHGPESTFGRERRTNPYVGGT